MSRSVAAFWVVFAADFLTSAYFISAGYASAETNAFQRAFVASPGLATLEPWLVNQGLRIALGAVGLAALLAPKSVVKGLYFEVILAGFAFVQLFGVASNVAFMAKVFLGVVVLPPAWFALLSVPLMLAFWGPLKGLPPLSGRTAAEKPVA